MKRTLNTTLLLLCTLTLVFATSAYAQEHQHPSADTTRSMPMDHGDKMDHDGMMSAGRMEAMMQMHDRMMADPVIHEKMMADAEMRATMQKMMGSDVEMAAKHARMASMPADERHAMMERMHRQMMDKMMAMPKAERKAMMDNMMAMHEKIMADPEMHERMMADPEMRKMMEQMMKGGMMKDGEMKHEGMDHDQMDGMDHDQMDGMDHRQMQGMKHDQVEHASMSASEVRDAEAASRTADRFRRALVAGDREAVMALLHPDVVILEGGTSETRSEYLGHHFEGDTAFLAAMEREPLKRRTEVAGDAAWVTSTRRLYGTYKDRTLDLDSAELLVLRRDASAPEGWRIAAVHWSSARR